MNGERTKRQLVCENSRFHVYFDDWIHEEQRAQNYLVVAPKLSVGDLVTGVAVLPVCDGSFGLLKIFRHAVERDCWEIPRGFVEAGETEIGSALRELQEETGLSCAMSETESLGFVTPDAGILAARVHLYAAKRCARAEGFAPVEFGHREFRLFSRAEFDGLIARGEIQDPSTLVAYYKYSRL